MASRGTIEQEVAVFQQHQQEGQTRWFVRVSCSFLEPRVYGPFPDEQEAERFRGGAEFELRKLLDCELPSLTSNCHFPALP